MHGLDDTGFESRVYLWHEADDDQKLVALHEIYFLNQNMVIREVEKWKPKQNGTHFHCQYRG